MEKVSGSPNHLMESISLVLCLQHDHFKRDSSITISLKLRNRKAEGFSPHIVDLSVTDPRGHLEVSPRDGDNVQQFKNLTSASQVHCNLNRDSRFAQDIANA